MAFFGQGVSTPMFVTPFYLTNSWFVKTILNNTDSQNENFFLKGHDLLVTNRPKKKFPSHVVFVGGVKIFFLSLEAARAKRGLAFGVKVNAFKRLKIQNYCGQISLKTDD